jgi:hypothetical protein
VWYVPAINGENQGNGDLFMPELNCIIGYLVGGFVALAMLNLLLEVLGLSLLGGDRKPGLIVRLILVVLLSGAAGYGLDTYVLDGDHHMKIKMHMNGDGDSDYDDEAMDDAAEAMDDAAEAMDDASEAMDDAAEAMDDAAEDMMEDAVEDAADDMMEEAVEEAVEDMAEEAVEDAIEEVVEDLADEMVDDALDAVTD